MHSSLSRFVRKCLVITDSLALDLAHFYVILFATQEETTKTHSLDFFSSKYNALIHK